METVSHHIGLHYLGLYSLFADQAAQDKVRDKAQGRGLLYPDTFSEERLGFLPAATSVLLVVFSRNHNVSGMVQSVFKSLMLISHAVHCGENTEDKRMEKMVGPSSC